jgi:hypothetical protein
MTIPFTVRKQNRGHFSLLPSPCQGPTPRPQRARGAHRIPALLLPVYNSLDFICRDLIRKGLVEVAG